MKIAVIGTGRIGSTLGQQWRAAGHEVVYGSRTGSGTGPGDAPAMTVGEALTGTEAVLLAVPGPAVAEVAADGGCPAGPVVRTGQAQRRKSQGGAAHHAVAHCVDASVPGS